jgi:NAD(P)H-hydrate repair Nnr-like enzyme with NAD(P)H-hydrate dehydratase domain
MLSNLASWPENAESSYLLAGMIGGLVATNYIEILNDPDHLARVAASGAFIHNSAAVTVSKNCPISASAIIEFIPSALQKILK